MVCKSLVRSPVPTSERADAARAAGLAFVNGGASGWGRAELAAWLVAHYAPATHEAGSQRRGRTARREDWLRDEQVARLVAEARLRVARFLETIATTPPATLARDAVEQGIVVAADDAHGGIGFLPVSRPEMRLVARVIALFTADYLSNPRAYEAMTICHECGMIAFGPVEAHAAWCEPAPQSGCFRKSSLAPEPFPLVRDRAV